MKESRLKCELNIIYERLLEMRSTYEILRSRRQEPMTGVGCDKLKLNVYVRFNTFLFEITHPENKYVISWYHKKETDINHCKYIKDGFSECNDLSEVVRAMDDYIYSGFSPDRSLWWQLHEKPKYFTRKRVWGP